MFLLCKASKEKYKLLFCTGVILRLQKMRVTFAGGLRDDNSGMYVFIFMKRKDLHECVMDRVCKDISSKQY